LGEKLQNELSCLRLIFWNGLQRYVSFFFQQNYSETFFEHVYILLIISIFF
jgi:hypothetical protein